MTQAYVGRIKRKAFRAKATALTCAAAWIAAAAGCGSSVYAEKFQHRLEVLKTSSEFSAVLTDLPTDGLPVNFRIPKTFTKAYNQISGDVDTGNHRIMRQKFAPAFLTDFPGLQLMFEGEAASGKDFKAPYYLYIGEGDLSAVKGKFPYEEWRARIKRGTLVPSAWEDVDVPTPKGKGENLKWKRLTATGKHVWDMTPLKTNTTQFLSVDTFFQMWVYETPQTIAVLGWWSTQDGRASSDIEKLAMVTAGTAVVSQVASAPSAPVRAK